MMIRILGVLIAAALALGGVGPTPARAQTSQPAILAFESSLESITLDEAEAGAQTSELSWYTANMSEGYRLRLLTYRRSAWEPVFGDESIPLEPVGSRVVTVEHPLTFAPPTYLLSIVDAQQRVIDQRTLTIPYKAASGSPVIERFAADVASVDAGALSSRTALVQVSWQVARRAEGSNLVFEQVFEDSSASRSAATPVSVGALGEEGRCTGRPAGSGQPGAPAPEGEWT